MNKMYGLIGYPLSHSFSKKYFEDKFRNENLQDCIYSLFEIREVEMVLDVINENTSLQGLNVTIPYKETIIPYLSKLDESATKVGAVNVIKIEENTLVGYNSDFYGFEKSLLNWLPSDVSNVSALILGSGGAAKAVKAVFRANNINYTIVSRKSSSSSITYSELQKSALFSNHHLIINTTPLGMAPNLNESPKLPYEKITADHFVYDLVYNPIQSQFLQKSLAQGAKIKNGLEMLEFQADKSWEIWTS